MNAEAGDVMGRTTLSLAQSSDNLVVEPGLGSRVMQRDILVVGVFLARNVFQVHEISPDERGHPPATASGRAAEALYGFPHCLIGIESCESAHQWAHQLIATGHQVRFMPAIYMQACVKRGKTDAVDADDALKRTAQMPAGFE